MKNPFPDFVSSLPVRDYGIEDLIVHADKGECGETYFVYAEKEIPFPEHAHGEQWTVVLEGECYFTANGKTCVYKKGDTYHIPADMPHQITLHPGYAEMDYTLYEDNGKNVMRKIDEDLKKGFELESQGVVYLAFAEQADKDGMDHIARLFRAAAESEKVHALIHYKFMKKIGETRENLKYAADAEKKGYTTFYPEMIKDAEAARETAIAQCFRALDKVEEGHAEIFARALKDPFSIKEDTEYYVCSVCGYLSEGPCDKCPACGVGADKFKKVE